MTKTATTCADCQRAVYTTDVDTDGLCVHCRAKAREAAKAETKAANKQGDRTG